MRHRSYAIGAAIVFVVVLFLYHEHKNAQEAKYSQRAEIALAEAAQQEARADSLEFRADSLAARGDSLSRIASERGRRVKSRVAAVRAAVVPDTCAPFVAQRDSVITQQDSVIDEWSGAYASVKAAYDIERGVSAELRTRGDSLAAVLRAAPKPRSRVALGVFAGYCVDGRPCAGVGVTVRVP